MERLFNRSANFILGDALYDGPRVESGRVVNGIHFSFTVTRSGKAKPDKLELQVTNLSSDTIAMLESGMRVVLNAGYESTVTALFVGQLRRWETVGDHAERVTTLVCGDGDAATTKSPAAVSLTKGADLGQVVGELARAMGLNGAKAVTRVRQLDVPAQARTYPRGFAVNGSSSVAMSKALARAGLAWTSRDGEVVVLAPREVLPGQAVLLTADTGLIGSPNPSDKKEGTGPRTTSLRSLLQGGILPGTAMEVHSDFVNGLFRAQAVKHTGDTHGGPWYTDVEAMAL